MRTYHIHIGGLVQGVGFRPFVYRTAVEMGIKGWVSNNNDGVHIECTATDHAAGRFYHAVLAHPPVNAMITTYSIREIQLKTFDSFTIQTGTGNAAPDLLITPDLAICTACKQEVLDDTNRRFRYPFTTCLNCGPRYSIMKTLPYDRHHTTMDSLPMCIHCHEEYLDVHDKRHYSQTNTCPQCAVPMHLFDAKGKLISSEPGRIFNELDAALKEGKTAAVKGIGGYLLLCDATDPKAIETLRAAKHRPAKPFALLYKDIDMVCRDVAVSNAERAALMDRSAPIVLCMLNKNGNGIIQQKIAPGLHRIGIMLPYTALLLLIMDRFNKPLIATSANFSGSPVIYRDQEALAGLEGIADLVLTFDRDIVTPQDDSVLQFSSMGQKIMLRRGRGLAPAFINSPFDKTNACILAMGGELKSAFALYNNGNLLVSQYLGDQAALESQNAFLNTKEHVQQLFQCRPQKIIVDKHPGYFVSELGRTEAVHENAGLLEVQHHEAHFAAVLAENNLLNENEPVLGVIWDGSGYGNDEQIWGSEFFIFANNKMKRIAHLDYFPQLLGDKMNREPRLSALCLLTNFPRYKEKVRHHFTGEEWKYYQQLLAGPITLHTCSMGRFMDGIAALLGICAVSTYEGEAAMQLEAIAMKCAGIPEEVYALPLQNGILNWQPLIGGILNDIQLKKEHCQIAKKLFYSLAMAIDKVSSEYNTEKIAFSGGVFQNALLTDMLLEKMKNKKQLYFHQELSPNDECIGFGQLAHYFIHKKKEKGSAEALSETAGSY